MYSVYFKMFQGSKAAWEECGIIKVNTSRRTKNHCPSYYSAYADPAERGEIVSSQDLENNFRGATLHCLFERINRIIEEIEDDINQRKIKAIWTRFEDWRYKFVQDDKPCIEIHVSNYSGNFDVSFRADSKGLTTEMVEIFFREVLKGYIFIG